MSKAFCEKACSSGQLDGTQGAMAQGVRRHALGWSMPHHLMSTRELRVGHRCGTHQLADTANEIFLSQILAQASENMIIESNPLKKKKNHVLFCSVLSDLLKTNVPETCCVCRKKRESISGSLTWIMFGVLCELITIGQCLPEQYYSVKKKKKKKTCKSSIVFLPDISYPVWEVKSCWL